MAICGLFVFLGAVAIGTFILIETAIALFDRRGVFRPSASKSLRPIVRAREPVSPGCERVLVVTAGAG